MYWNANATSDWTIATLNEHLNENNHYYNKLSNDAKNMIGTAKYYLGGYSDANITSDVMWQYERKNDANRNGYYYGTNPIMQNDTSKKIAIMYASDYGYGASKECTNTLMFYDRGNCATTINWLNKEISTWFLTHSTDVTNGAFQAFSSGYITSRGVNNLDGNAAVFPVLYLSSNVKISGGKGTSSNPYTLSQ